MNSLKYYNDHTRYLTHKELKQAERIANYRDTQFSRGAGNGQGDWNTFFSQEVRKIRFGK